MKSDTGNLAGVYRTLCNYCHIPELFGHPSSEAKMMKELKDENASLNRENEQLKLRIEALTNSKRRSFQLKLSQLCITHVNLKHSLLPRSSSSSPPAASSTQSYPYSTNSPTLPSSSPHLPNDQSTHPHHKTS